MPTRTSRGRRPAAGFKASALALLLSASPVSIDAALAQNSQPTAQRSFSIPAGPLSSALVAFGQQASLQVSYVPSVAAGRNSPGVSGTMSRNAALARLLSGTGLSFQVSGANTVVVSNAGGNNETATVEGAIALDTIDVSGHGGAGADLDPNAIYTTPAAVAIVNREKLDRIPPTSTGDILKGIPGVIVGDNRNGGGFQPNIRGAQGMSRVKVIIDGTENSPSTYRGYGGNSDSNYLDPDFLAGFSVQKGPVAEGGGAIGGTLNMRTFDAGDIIKDGKSWGLRLRGMVGDNSSDGSSFGSAVPADRIADITDKNYSGSAVGAWRPSDMFELVAGYARRRSGNYDSGENGDVPSTNTSFYAPGQEVFGTYSNSRSAMLKGAFTPTDEHRLSFGYSRYENQYTDRKTASTGSYGGIDYRYPYPSDVVSERYNASYAWTPTANPWLNLKADAWHVDTEEDRAPPINQEVTTKTDGARLSNRSDIDLSLFTARLDIGGQYKRERVTGERVLTAGGYEGQNDLTGGEQDTYGLHANLELPVTSWLTLHGGARHDWYQTERDPNSPTSSNHSSTQKSSGDGATFNLGFVLKPIETVQIYGKYSEGWRAPTMREELLLNDNIGRTPIRPERSENYEIGVNYRESGLFTADDTFGTKVSFFDTRYDDYIAGNGFWPGFHNAKGAVFQGLEVSLNYDQGWAYVEYGLTHYFKTELCGTSLFGPAYAAFFGQDGCFDVKAGDFQSIIGGNIPPTNKHDLTLGFRLFDRKLEISGTMTRVDGAVSYDPRSNLTSNADYMLFDAFATYRFENDLTLNVSGTNLTDQYYLEAGTQSFIALPSPGRTIRATLTKEF